MIAEIVAHQERSARAKKWVVELLQGIGALHVDLPLLGCCIVALGYTDKRARGKPTLGAQRAACRGLNAIAVVEGIQLWPPACGETVAVVEQPTCNRASKAQLPVASLRGDAAGQLQLDGSNVVVEPGFQIARIVNRHPGETQAARPGWTEGEMLATAPVNTGLESVTSLDLEPIKRLRCVGGTKIHGVAKSKEEVHLL